MPIMRKEFKVGFGIGGVLLAVLTVAVVVRSHARRKAADASVVVDQTDTSDAGDSGSARPDATPITSTDPVAAPPASPALTPAEAAAAGKPTDPFEAPARSTWDKILLDGQMPPATPTVTPPPRGSDRAIGEHFGPAGHSGVTPGNFPATPIVASDSEPRTRGTPVLPPAARTASRTHVIVQGETLSAIARTAYGNKKYYLLIEKANPNIVAERLRPGTTIILPELPASEHADVRTTATHASGTSPTAVDSDTQYVIKPNDSLYRISMRLYGTPNKVDTIYELNKGLIGPDRGRLKLGLTLKLPTPPTSASR
jgi:nucleoid-associated protein YgaU